MTVRGQAVILKLNFQNRAITKKVFLLGHSVRNSNVHPVYNKVFAGLECSTFGCVLWHFEVPIKSTPIGDIFKNTRHL
jgi:hypothetical protein